jgi:hypothetical protein
MLDKDLRDFIALLDRFALSDIEAAALTGLSPPTVRLTRVGRSWPKQRRCRAAAVAFVERHRAAKSRSDLRLHEGHDLHAARQ